MYLESYRGSGRVFVPGVTAGVCHRPLDRPLAETHPPNYSINVFLVDSPRATRFRKLREEPWRLDPLAVSRSGHAAIDSRTPCQSFSLTCFLTLWLIPVNRLFLGHLPVNLSKHYTGSVTRRRGL
ncbi:hypothetical protein BH24ACT16_BH24ACT16_08160 [soil metagenome]